MTPARTHMRVKEAAQWLGVSKSTLYNLIAAGKVDARKAGTVTLVPVASLSAYLAALPPAEMRRGAAS